VRDNQPVTATLRPMLVTTGPLRSDDDRYAFEVKWDGFRALIHASPGAVRITSRHGHDMTARYPELNELGSAVQQPVVLDGEIVVVDTDGKPDFAALWFRNCSGGNSGGHLCFMAFDVVHHGPELVIDRPYSDRRAILERLELDGPHWCTPPSYVGDGKAVFNATKEMGLEGVVAKRMDSRYRPGLRSKSWTKTKHFRQRTFALLGWLPPEERRKDRGCVVLGLRAGAGIVVAGAVESGYGRGVVEQLPRLTRQELRRLQSPAAVWPESPPLTGEVKYLEWSPAEGLRHASLVSWGSRA